MASFVQPYMPLLLSFFQERVHKNAAKTALGLEKGCVSTGKIPIHRRGLFRSGGIVTGEQLVCFENAAVV